MAAAAEEQAPKGRVDPAIVAHLEEHGFAVVPGVADAAITSAGRCLIDDWLGAPPPAEFVPGPARGHQKVHGHRSRSRKSVIRSHSRKKSFQGVRREAQAPGA